MANVDVTERDPKKRVATMWTLVSEIVEDLDRGATAEQMGDVARRNEGGERAKPVYEPARLSL